MAFPDENASGQLAGNFAGVTKSGTGLVRVIAGRADKDSETPIADNSPARSSGRIDAIRDLEQATGSNPNVNSSH
jgi:hypothetical protein